MMRTVLTLPHPHSLQPSVLGRSYHFWWEQEEQMSPQVNEVMRLALTFLSLSTNGSFNSYPCKCDACVLLCYSSTKMDFILGLKKMVDRIYIVQDTKHFSLDNADSNVEVLTLKKIKYKKILFCLYIKTTLNSP